jgi:hypothetical protein
MLQLLPLITLLLHLILLIPSSDNDGTEVGAPLQGLDPDNEVGASDGDLVTLLTAAIPAWYKSLILLTVGPRRGGCFGIFDQSPEIEKIKPVST